MQYPFDYKDIKDTTRLIKRKDKSNKDNEGYPCCATTERTQDTVEGKPKSPPNLRTNKTINTRPRFLFRTSNQSRSRRLQTTVNPPCTIEPKNRGKDTSRHLILLSRVSCVFLV